MQQTADVRVDHVFQQGTERDIMERSVQSLTKACAEGVNVTVLAVGSAMSTKSSIVFDRIQDDSVVHLIFRSLFTALEAKASAINNSTHSSSDPGLGGASKKNQSFSFEIWASFVEFYEETMTVRVRHVLGDSYVRADSYLSSMAAFGIVR